MGPGLFIASVSRTSVCLIYCPTPASKMGCCCCTRKGCSTRADGRIYNREDVSCCCRFFCPCITVWSVDDCGGTCCGTWAIQAIPGVGYLLSSIFALRAWNPKLDGERNSYRNSHRRTAIGPNRV